MAGESRRQRRDARRALGDDVNVPTSVHRQSARVDADAAAGDAVDVGVVVDVGVTTGRRRRLAFIHESIAELRKVEWPKRPQVIQGTIVVIIACAVVGFYLWVADLGFKPLVRDVLLNR